MICVMKLSIKILWKIKITFLLSETLLFFFKRKYVLFLETYFFKISKNLIASAFFIYFFAEADTKKHTLSVKKKPVKSGQILCLVTKF